MTKVGREVEDVVDMYEVKQERESRHIVVDSYGKNDENKNGPLDWREKETVRRQAIVYIVKRLISCYTRHC